MTFSRRRLNALVWTTLQPGMKSLIALRLENETSACQLIVSYFFRVWPQPKLTETTRINLMTMPNKIIPKSTNQSIFKELK